jgi:hypothetical protein
LLPACATTVEVTSVVAAAVIVALPTEAVVNAVTPVQLEADVSAVISAVETIDTFSTLETVVTRAVVSILPATSAIERVSVPAPPLIESSPVNVVSVPLIVSLASVPVIVSTPVVKLPVPLI